MKRLLSILILFLFTSTASASMTQKWSKTAAEIGIIGESPPVMIDINNDTIKEIFWAGKPYDDRANINATLICVDGLTGNVLWSKSFPQYWGDGNEMCHLPVMVYDFDKDGEYEVICSGGTYCRDALTGEIEWSKTTDYFGWHNNGFIDYGDTVTLYTTGGGYVRRINGSTGEIIGPNQVHITYTCWGGVGISDMNHDGEYEISFGTRTTYGGLYLFKEDLTKLWNIPEIYSSSQPPKMYDVDNDGMDEIIVANQAGASSKIYIVEYDGTFTTIGPIVGLDVHVSNIVGDCDGDGNMEWISCNSNNPIIIDLVTKQKEATLPHNVFTLPTIADVLPDPGYEIIIPQGNPSAARIYRYNESYILSETFGSKVYHSVVGDIDNDTLNEIVLTGDGGMSVWETEVSTPYPEPITQIAFNGMRRLNDNVYYPLPGSGYNIPAVCGNGHIEVGENCSTCPQDLEGCLPVPGFELITFTLALFIAFYVTRREIKRKKL